MTAEMPEATVALRCPKCGDQETGVDAVTLNMSAIVATARVKCPSCRSELTLRLDEPTLKALLDAGVEPNRHPESDSLIDAVVANFADDLHGVDYLSAVAQRGRPWSP